jgi:IS605 OrfB family transposase
MVPSLSEANDMQQIITAKLKLTTTREQFQALHTTQQAYREALNAVSHYAFEQGKTSSVTKVHTGMYDALRVRYGLPSQLACSVERQVAATYKGLWTKLKKNAEHRRKKITKKRFKGLDKPPKYSSPTVQYTYERDYTFQRDGRVSIGTLKGRISVPYQGYDKHTALIQHGARIGDAKLWYDRHKKQFYLLVSLESEVPEPIPEQLNEVIGIDVGIRYLAVTSTSTGKTSFYPGKRTRHKANHYARLRKRLQHKGTRGAKRRLRRIEQRERRLKAQANHCIAKQIVKQHPHALIGLEQLTDIRERTKRKKRKRKTNGKGTEPVSPKARKANRVYSQWSFAELHALLSYKAALSGGRAIKVDADYTSQTCPCCGYTSEQNRPKKGLLFVCQNPQCVYRLRTGQPYTLHADLIGARNVILRTLLVRQDWIRTGLLCAPREAQWTLPSEDGATEAKVAKTAPYLLPKGQRGQQHGAKRPMKFERYKPQVGQLGRIRQRLDCLNPSRGDATPIRRPNERRCLRSDAAEDDRNYCGASIGTSLQGGGNDEREPTYEPSPLRNPGIAYTSRDAWRRRSHSTQTLIVTDETGGRALENTFHLKGVDLDESKDPRETGNFANTQ